MPNSATPFLHRFKWRVGVLLTVLPALFQFWSASVVTAAVRELPVDWAYEVLSESVPTAFEVFPLSHEDFSVEWRGNAPDGVQISIVPGSIQWVRVAQLLVLPRGRIRISGANWDSISVRASDFVETSGPGRTMDLTVPLFAVGEADYELQFKKEGVVHSHHFRVHWKGARKAQAGQFVFDSSCSPFFPQVKGAEKIPRDQWAYLGCRVVRNRVGGSHVASLEIYFHWENAAPELLINGFPVKKSGVMGSHGFPVVRLASDRAGFEFALPSGQKVEVRLRIPPRLTYASLGLGIGPYSYYFEDGVSSLSNTRPIATFYGSYFLTESSRVVFFDAFAPGPRGYNDFGLYFNNESSRALDDRLSINILLGFHIIGFRATSGVAYRLGVPQGFEMIFRDAFKKRFSASAGGFFYPPIAGKSYYNSWVRYGTAQFFGEINYIAWSELGPESERVYSRSLGVTLGAPLFFLR